MIKKEINNKILTSSFRDPSGFLFYRNGKLLRQINNSYKENYDLLMNSGLYKKLIEKNLLIPHKEIKTTAYQTPEAYKIIQPKYINFISYPYEWSFSQLKDAALITLDILSTALEFDMILKDSSAYNIQFVGYRPIFIDTLSFKKYKEGEPWIAYKQFCQHFFGPLALMSYNDIRLNQLSRIHIDGIPIDLISKLLPKKTYFKFSLFSHLHLHAKSQKHFAKKKKKLTGIISKHSLLSLIDNLKSGIRNLNWQVGSTEWGNYYQDTNYSKNSLEDKKIIVNNFLDIIKPKNVVDFGANTGVFSRLASEKNIPTISLDNDALAVEKNYLKIKNKKEKNILALVLDLFNPSAAIGWDNKERLSFFNRIQINTAMALALIHHLAISNNLPLKNIAEFFSNTCRNLIIEFIPKNDSQVQRLLATRADIFLKYDKENFEKEFVKYFKIIKKSNIKNTERILYLLQNKK